jgi:spermidine synthase
MFKPLFLFAVVLTGLSGFAAQIILLRELLVVFLGNEISIGIILANWLILEALGAAFLGKYFERARGKLASFAVVQMLFSVFLPLSVYGARLLKTALGAMPGEALDIWQMTYSSFVILAPVSVTHGALFVLACKIYSLQNGAAALTRETGGAGRGCSGETSGAGSVYSYETLGTMLGGIILTWFLIPVFNSFEITAGLGLANFIVSAALLMPGMTGKGYLPAAAAALIGAAVFGYMEFGGAAGKIHRQSVRRQWGGQNVVYCRNSIYGNVTALEMDGQYSFFSDGIPVITAPVPDIAFVEEFAHFALLSHPAPKTALVLGHGAGGLLGELLKHRLERLDYAELNPLLLDAVAAFPTRLTAAELSDPRVTISRVDGRLFVRRTKRRYDAVIVGSSNPSDLQINRLFTREFYGMLKNRLNPGGIVAVALPGGSLTYIDRRLVKLNNCVFNTLKSVYPHIKVIPGEFNIFLASASDEIMRVDSALLAKRFSERAIKAGLITGPHLAYRLHPGRSEWFEGSVRSRGKEEEQNRDFSPKAVYHSLVYWSSMVSPRSSRLLERLEDLSLKWIALCAGLFALIMVLFHSRRLSGAALPVAICFTGFSGMIYNLVLIFAFQALYGYVYHWIGILTAFFMAGIASGSLLAVRLIRRTGKAGFVFAALEAALVVFSCLLPAALAFLQFLSNAAAGQFPLKGAFLALCLVSGFLTGAQFPAACEALFNARSRSGGAVGLLYGLDLLGGWAGGIAGGIFLLPVLGLNGACLTVAFIKLAGLALVTAAKISPASAGINKE